MAVDTMSASRGSCAGSYPNKRVYGDLDSSVGVVFERWTSSERIEDQSNVVGVIAGWLQSTVVCGVRVVFAAKNRGEAVGHMVRASEPSQ